MYVKIKGSKKQITAFEQRDERELKKGVQGKKEYSIQEIDSNSKVGFTTMICEHKVFYVICTECIRSIFVEVFRTFYR